MNLLRCVFALAVLYGLSAAAAAEPVTLLLPNECADFALNHDNGDLAMAPHGVYATAQPDRWLTIAVRDDAEWQALARAFGDEARATDARYATAAQRLRARDELDALVTHWLAGCDADTTAARLQQAGVCAHVSWHMQDIAADPLRAQLALVLGCIGGIVAFALMLWRMSRRETLA